MSLRLRLTLFGGVVVAVALIVFGALLFALFSRGVLSNQDDALRTRAHDAASALNSQPVLQAQAPLAPVELSNDSGVFVEVIGAGGSVLYTTGVLNGSPPEPSHSLLAQAGQQGGAFATEGPLRLYVLPISGGYVMAGQSTKVPQSNLSGVVTFLVISAVPALVAALIASYLVAGRALAPLKAVAGTADEIGRTRDFGRRLREPRSRDEVAALSSSFNRMLSRLQDAFESQRRFVADASHELRTPLTTIQTNAVLLERGPAVGEDVRRAAAADIAEESDRMARLVERMLTLARADAGLRLALAPIEIRPVVEEVCRQAAALHPDMKLSVNVAAAQVDADQDALRQLLWILVDNAFRYARSSVEVRLSAEPGWARLVVADDGRGIPVEERERIFERFYRADRSRTGNHAGLGLSIARWIADQHHGRIVAGRATLGGAAFLVDLPLLPTS